MICKGLKIDIRFFFLIFSGILLGLWTAWPGILIQNNWRCFITMIDKSTKDKIPLKAALAVPPNYFLKIKKNNIASKIRIVSDACFR